MVSVTNRNDRDFGNRKPWRGAALWSIVAFLYFLSLSTVIRVPPLRKRSDGRIRARGWPRLEDIRMTVGSGSRCVSSGTVRFGPPAPSLRRPLLRAPLFLFPFPRISPTRDRVPRVFYCCSNGHRKGEAESRRGFDSSSILGGVEQGCSEEEFLVVSFYKFVFIQDPEAEVSKHHSFLQGRDICGRIYVNEQGINAQYSAPAKDALAYAEWLKEDHRFSDILVQTSPSFDGHSFPRLKLRYKPSLVQLEGGITHLPLLNPMMRATPLSPSEWRKRLQTMTSADVPSGIADILVSNRNFLLLDVRNGYEWDVGHFQGAQRPNVDCFRSTSFGLSDEEPLIGTGSVCDTLTPDGVIYKKMKICSTIPQFDQLK